MISKGNRFGHYPRVPGIAAAAVDRVKRAGLVYGGGAFVSCSYASLFLSLYTYSTGNTACHTSVPRFIRFALPADFYSPLVTFISLGLTFFLTPPRPLEQSHPCNCARARARSDVKVCALGGLWRERSQHCSPGPLGPTNLRHYGLSPLLSLSPLPTTYWQRNLLSRAGITPGGEPLRKEELYAGNISVGLSTLRVPHGPNFRPTWFNGAEVAVSLGDVAGYGGKKTAYGKKKKTAKEENTARVAGPLVEVVQ